MPIKAVLEEKKAAVLRGWLDLILADYPQDSTAFFKREKNRFANPVGYALRAGIEVLYDHLIGGVGIEEAPDTLEALEGIIKIRAVQDFTPTQAVSFIFLLKKAIRREIAVEIKNALVSPQELAALDSGVDDMALLSFDIYMRCREKIHEVRSNQIKNMSFTLLKRGGMPDPCSATGTCSEENISSKDDVR
jgi:hypothetical protein